KSAYLHRLRDRRHKSWHVTPQIERAEIPPRSADPFLRPAHVFNDQRDMPPGRLASLALDAETGVEERVVRRRQRLRARPRHSPVAIVLAGRRGDDQRRVLELRAVQRAHVLDDQLRGITVLAVFVALDVEAD